MNQEYQDLIDKYLLGQMSKAESHDFEIEVAKQKGLKEQLMFTKNVQDAIVCRNRRLAQINEWKEAYLEKEALAKEQKPQISKRRYLYWASGIAAIFIVAFSIFAPIDSDSKGEIPISVNVASLRNGIDNSNVAKMINEGKYDLSLRKIEEKIKSLKIENIQIEQEKSNMDVKEYMYLREVHEIQMDELNLLKAYALFGLKQFEEALAILDEIRKSNSKFKTQADSLYILYK